VPSREPGAGRSTVLDRPVAPRTVPPRAPIPAAGPPSPHAPAWQVSGALLLVLAVASGSLHVLFADQYWWPVVVSVLLVVLAAAAVTRGLVRAVWAPTAVASVVLVGVLTLYFAAGTAIAGLVPTPETIDWVGALLGQARESINSQGVPAVAGTPIVFVLCLGIGAVAVVADLVAVGLRAPMTAGVLVLVVAGVPAATRPNISDPFLFLLTAAAFLALLVVAQARRRVGAAVGLGATALVGTVLLPLALPALDIRDAVAPAGSEAGVNPVLDLGDDLRRSSERTVLDYGTATGAPHYLRLVTLERFTAETWAPTEREPDTDNTVDGFGEVPGLSDAVATAPETTDVDIRNLRSEWLPVPYPARSIDGLEGDDWYWDAEGLSVQSPDSTPRGEEYEVESLVLQPTPEQLLAADPAVPAGFERYLDLPDDLPQAIPDTAAEVVGAAPTSYERAIALQEFFRSDRFAYSEDAPVEGGYDGTGMDVIAEFLEARSGYCVHFSSAMAIMARTLDIPSRVVVGFLPGTPADDRFTVTTHDLHSWPELYFDGVGWVQFEPTPGRGELGDYADPQNEGVPAPQPSAAPQSPTPAPSASPTAPVDRGAEDPDAAPVPVSPQTVAAGRVGLVLLALVALSLAPAVVRLGQRARTAVRLRDGDGGALDAWHEVLRTAVDLGLPVTVRDTPRATARSLLGAAPRPVRDVEPVGARSAPASARSAGPAGSPLSAGRPVPVEPSLPVPSLPVDSKGPIDPAGALDRLLAATERAGYGSSAAADAPGLGGDVRAVRAGLAARVRPWSRVRAALYPVSVWRRILHPLRPPV